MMTEKTIKALQILSKTNPQNPMHARRFAELMWPGSKGWNKVTNTGNGATHGKGMWLCAGSYLSKLQRKGLVHYIIVDLTVCYCISFKGKNLLILELNNNA